MQKVIEQHKCFWEAPNTHLEGFVDIIITLIQQRKSVAVSEDLEICKMHTTRKYVEY